MSSYSPMPNQFFREFCQPDLNTNPIYGLIHKAIDTDTRLNFLEEIGAQEGTIGLELK